MTDDNLQQGLSFAVLGAGSWGTALAAHLARRGHAVTLWGRDAAQIDQLQKTRQNLRYLPDIDLPKALVYNASLAHCVQNADSIIIATPSHQFDAMLTQIKPHLQNDATLIWACKGFSQQRLLHEIVTEHFGSQHPAAVLSGPSFANELANGLPTAVTIAATTLSTARLACQWFHGESFRAYASDDLVGVQVAGAVKNVFAIAAGISDGLGFGANARSALITRGLAELMRLGNAMGAQRDTLMGLSGVGDLVLTCTDDQSRNRRFGLALGQGLNTQQALEQIGQTVEGRRTCFETVKLAARYNIEMPITEQVYNVVHGELPARDAVGALLARASKTEFG